MEDAQALKPTLFVSVPRLFNKVYAKVKASTLDAPGIRGVLFRKAYQDKLLRLQQGQGCKHALWDRLLFQKVRAVLGGEIDLMVTGSAPLGNEVLQFLRVFFACEVLEGYGQTENAAGATLQVPGTYTTGHVGVPFVSCELKLVDVPDMNYHAAQGKGEIWLRGPIVFPGYWKDPVKTEEALDKDGWLRTGDIGALGPAGVLSIIDRKKNIFKLSQGEYIAPEKLENIYLLCPLLAQIFVHGDSLQSHLVAIVVPNEETFLPWAKKWVGGGIDKSKLSKNKAIHQALLKELDALARSKKLKGFEMIKALFIEWTPFSIENELLTPSFKLKRSQAVNHYRKEIDEMYQYIQKEINGKEDNPFFPKKANL
ncbi:Long-chain-fatty-acid--CoA ligase 1 [Coelomomyces lativittatus]|nr:Long-chain-fatty-acid--CoA ligase 1 [Coelomomyces lativittatus]